MKQMTVFLVATQVTTDCSMLKEKYDSFSTKVIEVGMLVSVKLSILFPKPFFTLTNRNPYGINLAMCTQSMVGANGTESS